MDTKAELIWLTYTQLSMFTVADNQTYKVASWPVNGKIKVPVYGVYVYTKLT